MAQTQVKKEEEIKKTIVLTKEALYTFLNYLKTGDKKYSAKLVELLNTEVGEKKLLNDPVFKETFNKFLDGRLAGDPGLAKFVAAYKKDKKTVDPAKLIKTVEDLYLSESLEGAIKKYGEETVEAFWHMSVWRLASHTVNTINSSFDYDKLTSAKEEYKRLEKEFLFFGHPLAEYQSFVDTFTEMLGKKIVPEFSEFWSAHWNQFGEVSTMQILEAMDDCRSMLEDEAKGKKAAEKKYGKEFISITVSTLGMGPKVVATKKEEKEPPPELVEVGKIKGLPDYSKFVEDYHKKEKAKKVKLKEEKKKKKKKKKKGKKKKKSK